MNTRPATSLSFFLLNNDFIKSLLSQPCPIAELNLKVILQKLHVERKKTELVTWSSCKRNKRLWGRLISVPQGWELQLCLEKVVWRMAVTPKHTHTFLLLHPDSSLMGCELLGPWVSAWADTETPAGRCGAAGCHTPLQKPHWTP